MDPFHKLIIELESIQSFGDQSGTALLALSAHILSDYAQESFKLLTNLGIFIKLQEFDKLRESISPVINNVEIKDNKLVLKINKRQQQIFADIPNIRDYLTMNNIDLTTGEGLFALGVFMQPKNLINFTMFYHQKELMKVVGN